MLISLKMERTHSSKELKHQIWDWVEIARDQQVELDPMGQAGDAIFVPLRTAGPRLSLPIHEVLVGQHIVPPISLRLDGSSYGQGGSELGSQIWHQIRDQIELQTDHMLRLQVSQQVDVGWRHQTAIYNQLLLDFSSL